MSGTAVVLRRARTFATIGWRRQVLFLEALALVTFAWLATHVLPFRWVRPLYGRPRKDLTAGADGAERFAEVPADVDPAVRDVSWALHMVHTRLFWDRSCLARAIAGRIMLRRRGYAPTLYIGAHKESGANVKLHAWLVAEGAPVAGVREARSFTTLAIFDDD